MKTAHFDYHLPPERIAQTPVEPRDASRLLVLHRQTGVIEHRRFHQISDYLQPNDLLIANNSRVIPARLHAQKATGGQAEVFLLEQHTTDSGATDDRTWRCLVRGRNIRPGTTLTILPQAEQNSREQAALELGNTHAARTTERVEAHVQSEQADGIRIISFSRPVSTFLDHHGQLPLPPYITGYSGDPERYQTVYSQAEGSVAAPTAGLHFTPELLLSLRRRNIQFQTVTLHVGLDTFRPVEVEEVQDHTIHTEWAELPPHTAQAVNQTTLAHGRIVAVGTTAVRTLEWGARSAVNSTGQSGDAACPWQRVAAFAGPVELFIRPGYRFRAVDALITNFHLPRSTLLMLVSAFAGQSYAGHLDASHLDAAQMDAGAHEKGRQMILAAYKEAIAEEYRFYSFGDAMLIL